VPGLLTRLRNAFGVKPNSGLTPFTYSPPVPPVFNRAETLAAMQQAIDESTRRPPPSSDEKVPTNYYGGAAGKIWFLPHVDSATKDSPEIRAAMRLMPRNPWVKSAWWTQILSVASQDWQWQPGEPGNPESEEQCKFAQTVVEEYTADGRHGCAQAICTPLGPDGFTIAEKVWGYAERGKLQRQIVLNAIKDKDPDQLRVEGDRFQNVLSVRPLREPGQPCYSIKDFVYTRYLPVFNDPLGMAAFRASYGEYWMLDTVEKLRVLHVEKRMAGTLIGTYENDDDKAPMENTLRALKSATWGLVPLGAKIESIRLSEASEPDYKSFVESKQTGIVTGISGASLQLMQGTVPDARANTKVQKQTSDLFPWLLTVMIQEVMNKQVIQDLIDFNYPYAAGGYPKITLGAVANQELLELLNLVEGAQRIGLKPSKKAYAKSLSIQEADPDDPDDALVPPSAGMGGLGGDPFASDPFAADPALGGGADPFGDAGHALAFSERVHTFGSTGWRKEPLKRPQGRYTYKAVNVETGEVKYGKEAREILAADPARKRSVGEEGARLVGKAKEVARQGKTAVGRLGRLPLYTGQHAATAGGYVGRGIRRVAETLAKWSGPVLGWPATQVAWLGLAIEKEGRRRATALEKVREAAAEGGAAAGTLELAKRTRDYSFGPLFRANRRKYGTIPAAGMVSVAWAAKAVGYAVRRGVGIPGLGAIVSAAKEFLGTIISGGTRSIAQGVVDYTLRKTGSTRIRRNPDAPGRLAQRLERGEPVEVPADLRPQVLAILKRSTAGRKIARGGFAEEPAAVDPLDLVVDLRKMINDMAAEEGLPPIDATDDDLAQALAEVLEWLAEQGVEQFAEVNQVDGFEALVDVVEGMTDEQLDGILVMVNPELGRVYIDVMDWGSSEEAKPIIKAAQDIVGEDNVEVANEGSRPRDSGWIGILSGNGCPAFAEIHTFAWEDWQQIEGGRWKSPGGRVLSNATFQKLRRGAPGVLESKIAALDAEADRINQSIGTGLNQRRLSQIAQQRHKLRQRIGERPPAKTMPSAAHQMPAARAGLGSIVDMDPREIAVDPGRFQFKLRTDKKTGVGSELQSVETYNPELAGVLAVWRDPANGKTHVVNGHHRLDLALRAGAEAVSVRYLKAATAEEARAKGALINIAEGRGTSIDAAKFLRDTGTTIDDLRKVGVSVSGALARDAVILAKLDGHLFQRVTLGVIEVPRALAIAAHLPNHEDQQTLLRHIEQQEKKTRREMPPGTIAEAAKELAATPRATVRGEGGSLFGSDPEEESVFLQRAELKSYVRTMLHQKAKDYRLLSSGRRAGNVADAGNVIDTTKNKLAAEGALSLVEDFDRSVNRAGPMFDTVNKFAAEFANAHSQAERDRIRRAAIEGVRKALSGPQLL
jgi:hypothetical protein